MTKTTTQDTLALTMRLKILPQSQKQIDTFNQTMIAYRDACNVVSQYIFDNIPQAIDSHSLQSLLSYTKLQTTAKVNDKRIYEILKEQFQLPAQLSCEVFKTVIANYKTVQTQLKKEKIAKDFEYDSDGNIVYYQKGKHKGKPKLVYTHKDLSFLTKPLCYKKPQLALPAGHSYSFIDNFSKVSISSLDGRIKLPFNLAAYQKQLFSDKTWKRGKARLVQTSGKWFLHVSFTKPISEKDISQYHNIIGIDAGLRKIMTIYDVKTKQTHFKNGQFVKKKRQNYAKKRQSLQIKGTKSAKRRLKRLSRRENRWMTNVNHCLSKTLVEKNPDTLIVVEDLTNITFETTLNRKKENRYEHHSWAFYQLQQFIDYKAKKHSSYLIKVNPAYTSQRCPRCGVIRKENRDKAAHCYHCQNCHYKSNDDRVAAINIAHLGQLKQNGVEKPSFKTYT